MNAPLDTAKHTPGPWETHASTDLTGYPCYYIHGFGGDAKRDTAMHEANARLIAAAPDLLEALRRLMKESAAVMALAENELRVACGNTNVACLDNAINRAAEAIKKARGLACP